MERLTKKGFNFAADFIKRDIDSWSIAQCLKKLQEYEDTEETSLLLRLPCKVGDTIYYVADGKITEKHVNGFLYTNQLYIVTEEFNFNCPASVIGHALFITREEAEAKLKELRGGK